MSAWDNLSRSFREAIKAHIVECLNEGESTIPGDVMNPKMADRVLPGAFDAMTVSERDISVDVRADEVVLRLRRGKPADLFRHGSGADAG